MMTVFPNGKQPNRFEWSHAKRLLKLCVFHLKRIPLNDKKSVNADEFVVREAFSPTFSAFSTVIFSDSTIRSKTSERFFVCSGSTFHLGGVLSGVLSIVLLLFVFTGCAFKGLGSPSSWSLRASNTLMQSGLNAQELGESEDARSHLTNAVRLCPQNSEARRAYAEHLWSEQESSLALSQMREAIVLSPDDAALRRRLAEMLLAVDESEAAFDVASDAVDLEPNEAEGWILRAKSFESLRQSELALLDYQHAIQCDPENSLAYEAMTEIYLAQNRPERAILAIQTLMDRTSDEKVLASARVQEGKIYAVLQRPEDARRAFQLAYQLNPTPEVEAILLSHDLYQPSSPTADPYRPPASRWSTQQTDSVQIASQPLDAKRY